MHSYCALLQIASRIHLDTPGIVLTIACEYVAVTQRSIQVHFIVYGIRQSLLGIVIPSVVCALPLPSASREPCRGTQCTGIRYTSVL
jgi:hypothetical protein